MFGGLSYVNSAVAICDTRLAATPLPDPVAVPKVYCPFEIFPFHAIGVCFALDMLEWVYFV